MFGWAFIHDFLFSLHASGSVTRFTTPGNLGCSVNNVPVPGGLVTEGDGRRDRRTVWVLGREKRRRGKGGFFL